MRFVFLVIVLLGGLWFAGRLADQKVGENDLECLAAIMQADAYVSNDPKELEVEQNKVADTVLQLRERSRFFYLGPATGSFCYILSEGSTIYPPGWRKSIPYFLVGRKVKAIKESWLYPTSPWNAVLDRARLAMSRGADKKNCANAYVRANPRYTWFTNEEQAQTWIRENMTRESNSQEMKNEYYCN